MVWLKDHDYNEKLLRQQILKDKKYRRAKLLYSHSEEVQRNNLLFNSKHYQSISKLKNILSRSHLILTPSREPSKVFDNTP